MQNFPIKPSSAFTLCATGLVSLCLFVLWSSINPVFAAYNPAVVNAQAAPAAAETIYVVQRGDTLYSLARRFGTTVDALMQLNNIANPNQIYVGQRLRIPSSTTTSTPTPTRTPTPTPASTSVWAPPSSNAIEVFSPVSAGIYHSPIEVIGFSQTFEGNVNIRLTDTKGIVLAQRNAIGGSVDGFAFFHTYVRFEVTTPLSAILDVFETSAKDGSEIHKVSMPLVLQPGQRVVDVDSPIVGAKVCSPLIINGYSNTFEATVGVTLRQRNNTSITQSSTHGGNTGVYANFTASFTNPVSAPQPRLVSAYEGDPAGRGLIDQTVVPVTLYPAGSSQCP
jgi:hypothetical protein